jgi:hypothetical protein
MIESLLLRDYEDVSLLDGARARSRPYGTDVVVVK